MTAVPLSAGHLTSLPAEIAVPAYDRSALTVGIVHVGVGGFHRAHQAMYLDRLLNQGLARDWAIAGIGVMPQDSLMNKVLHDQDGLYTLVVKHPDGRVNARVIGSLVRYLLAADDPEACLELLAAPSTRIVSLTVTEGGYHVDPATGGLDATDPRLRADLADGAVPSTAFGLLVEALRRRRARGLEPFTVLSCDNVQGNGSLARRMISAFAGLRDPELGRWIDERVAFPNSMVDRITPATTDDDRRLVERLGVRDGWPVVCEPFHQWVIEDRFPLGRPPLAAAGAQLVDDVEPYELMKLRLLNASHQAMAHLGRLAGHRYAHEVAADPPFAAFLRGWMDDEAGPTLQPLPGFDLQGYKQTLLERFSNSQIRDTVARLAAETSDRIPKFVLPVLRERLAAGGQVLHGALMIAAWARYAEGIDESGTAIEVVDPLRDRLMAAAARQPTDPLAFLRQRDVFGDLIDHPGFAAAYTEALAGLHRLGARAMVARVAGAG